MSGLPQKAGTELEACVQCSVNGGLTCLGGTSFAVEPGWWIADDAADCTSGRCILERVYECDAPEACSSGDDGVRNVTEFAQVARLDLCGQGHRDDVVLCGR
jgi:hypothetical protein